MCSGYSNQGQNDVNSVFTQNIMFAFCPYSTRVRGDYNFFASILHLISETVVYHVLLLLLLYTLHIYILLIPFCLMCRESKESR